MLIKDLNSKYHAFRGTSKKSKKIFIIGTGRSGTHWLGYILADHPKIDATIEKPGLFWNVTQAALDTSKRDELLKKIISQYRREHAKVSPNNYLDKSHPNIWLATHLAEVFEDAIFIGIVRNPYAVVASTLKHKGVMKWFNVYKKFPIPNEFLGITKGNAEKYADMPIAGKAALRWVIHCEKLQKLRTQLPSKVRIVKYEELAKNTKNELSKLKEFIGLEEDIPQPEIKKGTLTKWEKELTKDNISDIDQVLATYGRYGY